MDDEPSGRELIQRAEALRLPLARLAAEAGLNKHTLYQLARRSNNERVEQRTLRRTRQVIESYERALLVKLLGLHREWLESKGHVASDAEATV